MDSIFSETALVCAVCGSNDCVHFPLLVIPHVSDRARVPHVLAPEDVTTPAGPHGGAQFLYRKGDPVPLEVAARLGWAAEPAQGPQAPGRRRVPPTARAAR